MLRLLAGTILGLAAVNAEAGAAHCRVESDYELTLNPRGLVFVREVGAPQAIVLRQGRLFVDDAWVTVDAQDVRRLVAFEQGAREALPATQALAHAAADVAYRVLGEVAAGFGSDPEATQAKLAAARPRLDARLADAVRVHRFDAPRLGQDIARAVRDAVPDLIGEIAGSALSAAFAGDKTLLTRMTHLDEAIQAAVAPRAAALEPQAQALCQQLAALDALDDVLAYRQPDGHPLDLLRVSSRAGAPATGE